MSKSSPPATTSNPTPTSSLSRRRWFAGAGAVGAAATVAAVLPGVASQTEAVTPTAAKPAKGGGYTVSEHIRRYYQTTRV